MVIDKLYRFFQRLLFYCIFLYYESLPVRSSNSISLSNYIVRITFVTNAIMFHLKKQLIKKEYILIKEINYIGYLQDKLGSRN
jgi:hypothetical protein